MPVATLQVASLYASAASMPNMKGSVAQEVKVLWYWMKGIAGSSLGRCIIDPAPPA